MKVKGWKEVFRFTFAQQVKTKSFIIGTLVMTIIVALIAFLADFLPAVLMGDQLSRAAGGPEEAHLTVNTLYVSNETKYDFDFSEVASTLGLEYKAISASEAETKMETLTNSTELALVSRVISGENGFEIVSQYPGGETAVLKGDCEAINSNLAAFVRVKYLTQLGVPEDELVTAMSDVRTSLTKAGEEPVSMVKQIINTVVPMISSIILFVFIFSYSQLVAQSVAIEKSSRIIEYLLTSIKPLAIIVGKVLAMCCVSLLQFFIIGFGGGFGFLVSLPFGIVTKVGQIATTAGMSAESMEAVEVVNDIGDAFAGVDLSVIPIMIVTFILGFLLFSGLAGLAGASISKMEDLSSAIQPLSLIGVLGFYLAYFPQVTGEENTMSTLARYIPISSPFILPSDYLLGKIDMVQCLICIGILAVAVVLVMMFVAKVYETIILHTGNRLKIGDMLKMSK